MLLRENKLFSYTSLLSTMFLKINIKKNKVESLKDFDSFLLFNKYKQILLLRPLIVIMGLISTIAMYSCPENKFS